MSVGGVCVDDQGMPPIHSATVTLIERQFDAYNARDLPMFLATYAPDAEQWLADGTLLARGRQEIANRMRVRFADAALQAKLVRRVVVGDTVVDHEHVSRTGPHGLEAVEMVCMYAVSAGLIVRATFAIEQPHLLRSR